MQHTGPARAARHLALVAAMILAPGCDDDDDATTSSVLPAETRSVTITAPAVEPIVLRIGTDDEPGVPAADQIEHFAAEVDQRSGGAI